ncbi:MAG: class I SAM-dependent methyltransferase [Cytophagaceae bacterium]
MTRLESDIQKEYYTKTASDYDKMHINPDDGRGIALQYISQLFPIWGVKSILDVGAGTGRAVNFLLNKNFSVIGIEPVEALVKVGIQNGIPTSSLLLGNGERLPFSDGSFDAVCEFGVLHHVKNPESIVKEMLRVSRKVVVLCDSNRFARGSVIARVFKYISYKFKLWSIVDLVRTRGKGYQISEGDGLFYSYSVYDNFDIIRSWSDRVILIPLDKDKKKFATWLSPLFTSSKILLCGIKEE